MENKNPTQSPIQRANPLPLVGVLGLAAVAAAFLIFLMWYTAMMSPDPALSMMH